MLSQNQMFGAMIFAEHNKSSLTVRSQMDKRVLDPSRVPSDIRMLRFVQVSKFPQPIPVPALSLAHALQSQQYPDAHLS